MVYIRRFFHWLFVWFDKPKPAAPEAPAGLPKMKITRSKDNYGSLYFREDLLDRLDDYFADIKLLKRDDPDAYDLHRQIGGQVVNRSRLFGVSELEPAWRVQRPSFGMIYLPYRPDPADDNPENICVSSVYYQKFRRQFPGSSATIYEVTNYYIDRRNPDFRSVASFLVSVDRNGEIRPIRSLITASGKIPSKRWVYPSLLQELASRHKETPEQTAKTIFSLVANGTVGAETGIQVRATRDGLTASFAIDMLRTPYFFRDRVKIKTVAGFTRPIFHIVRAHARASGSVVKTHFRGIRRFRWADAEVIVSVPGLHHPPIQEFKAHALDASTHPKEPCIYADETGRRISEVLSR